MQQKLADAVLLYVFNIGFPASLFTKAKQKRDIYHLSYTTIGEGGKKSEGSSGKQYL